MNLVRFLLRKAPGLTLLTGLVALVGGACNAGLIALVNTILTRPGVSTAIMVWSFVTLGLGKLATTVVSQVLLAQFSQRAIAELRRGLIQKILTVPLRHFEEVGAPRLMVALTEDVLNITQALLMIPNFAVNLAILGGGAAYLGWLSWRVACGTFLFIVCGAAGYRLLIARGFTHLSLARAEEDKLFNHFRALTQGIKELKLHRNRRGEFLSTNIQATTEDYSRHNIAAEIRFVLAHGWSQLLFFALVGLVLFLLPSVQNISTPALTGYVVTMLYLMGPLAGVLGSLSAFGRAEVALQNMEKLGLSLAAHVNEKCPLHRAERGTEFETIDLRGVTHSYHHEKDDSHFMLGPLNLRFRPAEIVFIVGGNGSGKSTLAKIITGLYPPEKGEICVDGKPVTNLDRDDYRQLFSVVFSDFYLFENLLGLSTVNLDARAQDYLAQFHLDHKVKVRDGRLSTVELSQGQRKRLALLTAYLEDRPFYLFDEWASDQDPQFKEIFYSQLLPELKARRKAVLVITHDDKYFPLADRIIKLDYGRLAYDKQMENSCFEPHLQTRETSLQPVLNS
ncbi:MAG TPA: cyclic peptide export ABC transporter [Candidatus Acidoferrum sp.]|jgi:putative ATP-binding cassette transporter|nr:cyclic peptide export ABC transporter [Candidatus Acidoferrum sp.]